MQWSPHVTVAAVIESDSRFLLVEEKTSDGLVINQPAGHWEFGESLFDAVKRETMEETAHRFEPDFLLGAYSWTLPESNNTYLRFAFTGVITDSFPRQALDTGIVRALWLTREEIQANRQRLRSPLVIKCIEDYDTGKRFPLDFLSTIDGQPETIL